MFELKEIIKKMVMVFCLSTCFMSEGFGKVLKCPQVGILNIALADKLFVIARIKLAFKEASIVTQLLAVDNQQQKIDQKDQKNAQVNNASFIKAQLERMIAPVKEFFTEIREFSALIEPLLKESSEGKIEQSHLYAFLQSEDDLLPFFERRIVTRDQLKAFASEFKTLFGDLHDSLSPEVLKKYEKFVAEVKGKRPQGTKN